MMSDRSAKTFAGEKFRLAVEACPSAMVMTDSAGTIVLVNTETERLFGYRRDELIGRAMDMLVPQRLRGEYLKQRAVFAVHPEARRVNANRELFGLRRDNVEVPIEVWLNPIHTSDGLYVLSVMVDIGERKRIDRLKDEFVSTVSHELRTPLTSIAGSLGLLVGGAAGTLPDAALRLLTIAQTNSHRLVRLINDILDIEKIESGQVVFDFRRISTRALAEQAIEANRAYADGFAISIRLEPGSLAGEVLADQDRLAQVLTNLLSNAIKFSPRNGEVTIGTEQRGDRVRISVRDHGEGIPVKFRPHIFQKFAQADASDTRQKGGTGLGLSIVKEIVTRLGGSVGVEDAAGGGTVFFVELPAWEQIAAREIDADRTPDAVRILVCEDNPQAAQNLRDGLRPLGYSTDLAHNPADAVTRARSGCYAAIVVDFELPDGNGLGLIRQLREQPESYKTPIVVMSAERSEQNDEFSALHVVNWIAKPADAYELSDILDGAIARGLLRQAARAAHRRRARRARAGGAHARAERAGRFRGVSRGSAVRTGDAGLRPCRARHHARPDQWTRSAAGIAQPQWAQNAVRVASKIPDNRGTSRGGQRPFLFRDPVIPLRQNSLNDKQGPVLGLHVETTEIFANKSQNE